MASRYMLVELIGVYLICGSLVLVESCHPWEFECQSSGRCLKSTSRCNKEVECTDGSDELRCPEDTPRWTEGPCTEGQFQCDNKRCVYKNWVCDHEDDCGDNSDETDCLHESHSSGGVLGVGAVVGISLACSGVLLLFLCTLAYMLYHRVKAVHGLSRRDPVQEITDIMGSVPYHMPREALLRLPPPQYTSRTDLRGGGSSNVQENPGFVLDVERQPPPTATSSPPPLYTSQPDLAFILNQAHVSDLPPAYSSRTSLQEVGLSGQHHDVSPPLEVYRHHHHHPISQRPQSLQNHGGSQPNTNTTTNVTSPLGGRNDVFQQRRFRGRISRVRETLPVLSTLASLARRSLSRPRRLRRRSRGRHSNNSSSNSGAVVEHFYCEKPRALRRQEEYSRNSRQPASPGVLLQNTVLQMTTNTSTTRGVGLESTTHSPAPEIPAIIAQQSCSPPTKDLDPDSQQTTPTTVYSDLQLEEHSFTLIDMKECDDVKEDGYYRELSFPLNTPNTKKCRSVPELTLLHHHSGHVTTDVTSRDLSRGNPVSGQQKSHSLTHLLDLNLKPLNKQHSVHQSYLSLDSWNC